MMTEEELGAIAARARGATNGPWRAYQRKHKDQWAIDSEYIARLAELNGQETSAVTLVRADAEFIAHAREDIPALLAEIEWLQQQRQRDTLASA